MDESKLKAYPAGTLYSEPAGRRTMHGQGRRGRPPGDRNRANRQRPNPQKNP